MPPINKLDIDTLSYRRNNKPGAEIPRLSGGGDATETRENNKHHTNPERSPDDHNFQSVGSSDERADLGPTNTQKSPGSSRHLDAQSRQQLLLAIKDAPEHHLRQAFEALAWSVKNIPEGIFQMLVTVERETAGNGRLQAAHQAGTKTQRGADDRKFYNHNPRQVVAIAAPGAACARAHQEVHNPVAQAFLHTRPEPHQDLPLPALHAYQARERQYLPQVHPQSLPQALAQGPSGMPGAVNLRYHPMDPPAHIPHKDVACFVPRQAHPASGHRATGHIKHRYAPIYHAPPAPLGALAHAPEAPCSALIPPCLVARPGPVPPARMYAPVPQQPSQELEASGSLRTQGKLPEGPRWSTCANCRTEYDMTKEQIYGECIYHSGILQIKKNIAPGAVCILAKTHANREAYPKNFVWTCCDRDGTREGCEEDVHVPGVGKRGMKRARFD